MESRKLTKEDIDKVRGIEGFPIGTDEDIIALSDAPYYTACPNPFIEEFINKNGTPYDEATDEYHRDPFAADVSEGKNDPIYNAHSYHTKVPFKAIMKYLFHYTNPGDLVLDGFCGTGMTGVAAEMCGSNDSELKRHFFDEYDRGLWGSRRAIINDLSPIATFISNNYVEHTDTEKLRQLADEILKKFWSRYSWMYNTKHCEESGFFFSSEKGIINYTVWSDVFICPSCGRELCYWDVAVELGNGRILDEFSCSHCNAKLKKKDCEKAYDSYFNHVTNDVEREVKQLPVLINYVYSGKRYNKTPDNDDLALIQKINNYEIKKWIPKDIWPEGEKTGEPSRLGYNRVFQIYTKRNQIALAFIYDAIKESGCTSLLSLLTSVGNRNITRCNRFMINKYNPNGRINGPMPGNLYISSLVVEQNAFELLNYKLDDIVTMHSMKGNDQCVIVTNQSSNDLRQISRNSIDYIFVDPPFGYNINYSELNFINESWLKVKTNTKSEAIMSKTQGKGLVEYQGLMESCFSEYYRVLKPNRWITIEFHNSKNTIWNAIQEALQKAGFIVADVRTLDKKQSSINQDNARGAVQQDLVISAYKPKGSFIRNFVNRAGTEETAWDFVRQHLSNLPVVVNKNGTIEVLSERQAYLLFDRTVAYHIMQGIAVPLDSIDFYRGLDDRFLKRDNMYFLPDQINEYDMVRSTCEVETIQFSLFVSDEKSAISWLYQQLDEQSGDGPQTYQDLMPKFMQELKAVDKREKMPELSVILEENFLKDEDGKWYIPDLTKSGDIARLREKNLLKEFQEYLSTKGKLKLFRSEAIRAGFAKLWKDKDYATIVSVAERLPEETIQEDANLLMYYDISLGRV